MGPDPAPCDWAWMQQAAATTGTLVGRPYGRLRMNDTRQRTDEALETVRAGDPRPALALLAAHRDLERSSALRLELHLAQPDWMAAPEPGAGPDPESEAASVGAMVGFATGDAVRARAWADVARGGPRAVLADSWARLAEGHAPLADGALSAAEAEAAQRRDSAGVVELAALRALVAEASGELREALRHARRASRMARTEAMPQREYLANLVLARMRRLSGSAFLASHILTALQRQGAGWWSGWAAHEATFAGALSLESEGWAARHVRDAVAAAQGGDAATAAGHLAPSTCFAPADRDLDALRVACGLPGDDTEVAAWARGEGDELPARVGGLIAATAPAEGAAVYVLTNRSTSMGTARAHRLPAFWTAALGASRQAPSRMRSGREDSIAACLALAPEGLSPRELFERVYGFRYVAEMHEATLRVAIHRTRNRLGDAAVIHGAGGTITLSPKGPMLLPDPRCTRSELERLLLVIAQRPSSARSLAGEMATPLRTIQKHLRELVEEGCCSAQKEGREVRYVVEDTTFSEPTRIEGDGSPR